MWISKKMYNQLQRRLAYCEARIERLEEKREDDLYEIADAILNRQEELAEEIKRRNEAEAFADEIIDG